MKSATRPTRPALLLAAMLLAGAVSLPGCAILNKKPSAPPRATATLQRVQADYSQAERLAEVANEALDELANSPVVDLKQAYATFASSVDRVQATGERLVTHADEMRFRGASYIVESEKPATAGVPPLPNHQNQRKEELGWYFNDISAEAWEVKRVFRAYQFDLSQIRDYLTKNLSPKSIDTITPIIAKSKVDGESLKHSLKQAQAAVEAAKAGKAQKLGNGS